MRFNEIKKTKITQAVNEAIVTEGVRYGEKEKQSVLSSLEDFGFGIEIEMHVNNDGFGIDYDEEEEFNVVDHIMENDIKIEIDNSNSGSIAEAIGNDYIEFNNPLGQEAFTENGLLPLFGDTISSASNIDQSQSRNHDMFQAELYHGILYDMVNSMLRNNNIQISDISNDTYTSSQHLTEYFLWKIYKKDIDAYNYAQLVDDVRNYLAGMSSFLGEIISEEFEWFDDNYNIAELSELPEEQRGNIVSFMTSSVAQGLSEAANKLIQEYPSIISSDIDARIEEYNGKESDFIDMDEIENFLDYVYLEPNGTMDLMKLLDKIKCDGGFYSVISTMLQNGEISDDDYRPSSEERHNGFSSVEEIEDYLQENTNLLNNFQWRFEKEHDHQVEIILDNPVHGEDIITAYNDAFKMMQYLYSKHGFTTEENSGLHMSISYKEGSQNMDIPKFLIISNLYNILGDNSSDFVREYVDNIFDNIDESIVNDDFLEEIIENKYSGQELFDLVIEKIDDSIPTIPMANLSDKYQSVRFSTYKMHKGRVELRYFGGEGYEDKKEEFNEYLIRAMYGLKLACDPDEKRKEYQQSLWKFANKMIRDAYDVDIISIARYGNAYYKVFQDHDVDFNMSFFTGSKPFSTLITQTFSKADINRIIENPEMKKQIIALNNQKSIYSKKGIKFLDKLFTFGFNLE